VTALASRFGFINVPYSLRTEDLTALLLSSDTCRSASLTDGVQRSDIYPVENGGFAHPWAESTNWIPGGKRERAVLPASGPSPGRWI
jgi:hypothetical protein